MAGTWQARINQLALVASLVLFAAIGLLWWRDRTREWETPRWDASRFAVVTAPARPAGPRAVLAVHPGCSHCRRALAALARPGAADSLPAPLAVLLVDVSPRPSGLEPAVPTPGGLWWDSAGVWRSAWGRRVYGETFVFDSSGALVRTLPPRESSD